MAFQMEKQKNITEIFLEKRYCKRSSRLAEKPAGTILLFYGIHQSTVSTGYKMAEACIFCTGQGRWNGWKRWKIVASVGDGRRLHPYGYCSLLQVHESYRTAAGLWLYLPDYNFVPAIHTCCKITGLEMTGMYG